MTWTPAHRPATPTMEPLVGVPQPRAQDSACSFSILRPTDDSGLEENFPGDSYSFVCFGKVTCAKRGPILQADGGGHTLRPMVRCPQMPRSPSLWRAWAPHGATVQGDLLSSSYCVRLGRVRFRMENKATRGGGGGARGRQQTEEVSTRPLHEHPGGGVGRERTTHRL